jgi:hypothetical protein
MNQQQNNSNALTLLAGAVAGIVTVATSSGLNDFSDSAIGLVLSILRGLQLTGVLSGDRIPGGPSTSFCAETRHNMRHRTRKCWELEAK